MMDEPTIPPPPPPEEKGPAAETPPVMPLGSIPVILPGTPTEPFQSQIDAAKLRAEAVDRTTEGQRGINLMWETTQMRVAMFVVCIFLIANIVVIFVLLYVVAFNWSVLEDSTIAVLIAVMGGCLLSLSSTGSLVIGFYFGRTNHTRTGGVGLAEIGR